MRVFAVCEYDGTAYGGWQRQNNADTVQEQIETALAKLFGVKTAAVGAGRTDAGVHALGQVFHFDADTRIPVERLAYALNFILPPDIRITKTRAVCAQASARFSATGKHYRYTIFNRPAASPIMARTAWHVPYAPLCEDAIRAALLCLVGEHDFCAFMAAGSQMKTTVRRIDRIELKREGEVFTLDVWGNGFLYNMVRIIAGTMVDIGRGKLGQDTFMEMLRTLKRESGGQTAPPQGLIMMEVFYPEDIYIRQQ